jgi:beta-glucosidase
VPLELPGWPKIVEYRESIYVGYRYYDSARQDVRFPFGHGLSYTSFQYSNLELSPKRADAADGLRIRVKVTNTGSVGGKEIVQLYVKDVISTVFRPDKELKGFVKISLEPGESQTVRFYLDRRSFSFFDTDSGAWQVEPGDFQIPVGASSQDLPLSAMVTVTSHDEITTCTMRISGLQPYYTPATSFPISREAFEALYGKTIPDNEIIADEVYILDTSYWRYARLVLRKDVVQGAIRHKMVKPAHREDAMSVMARHMADELPLRNLPMISGGKVSYDMLEGLLMLLNGNLLLGCSKLIAQCRRNWRTVRHLLKAGTLSALSMRNAENRSKA